MAWVPGFWPAIDPYVAKDEVARVAEADGELAPPVTPKIGKNIVIEKPDKNGQLREMYRSKDGGWEGAQVRPACSRPRMWTPSSQLCLTLAALRVRDKHRKSQILIPFSPSDAGELLSNGIQRSREPGPQARSRVQVCQVQEV